MSRFFLCVLSALLSCSMAAAQQPTDTLPQLGPGAQPPQPPQTTPQAHTPAPVAGNAVGATQANMQGSTATAVAKTTTAGASTTGPAPVNATDTMPAEPVTKILSGGTAGDPNDVADLLAPKPFQKSKLSLIGGTVKSIDQIRDRMAVRIYGAAAMKVRFDQRTHFYRDGRETTQMTVKRGDRVYLDTQLHEGSVFARNVHVETGNSPADANGQIVSFNPSTGDMVVHDELASAPVRFRVSMATAIKHNGATGSRADLRPGALIAVKFSPRSRSTGTADEISIIAEPGTAFTYFGRVTHLDLKSGIIAVENQADGKTYEIQFNPARTPISDDLTVGSQVTAVATFEGRSYTAQSIDVNSGPPQAKASKGDDLTSGASDSERGDKNTGKHKKKAKDEIKKHKKDRDKDTAKDDSDDDLE